MKYDEIKTISKNKSNPTTISFNHEEKTITITRTNVSKTNKPDVRYVNLTIGKRAVINIFIKQRNYKLIVKFVQYKSIEDKRAKKAHYTITKEVLELKQLQLRVIDKNGKEYYRNTLITTNVEKILVSSTTVNTKPINNMNYKGEFNQNNYQLFNEDCVKTIKTMIDNGVKIPLIVTDPPYDIKNTKAGGKSQLNKSLQKSQNELEEKNLTKGIDYNTILPLLTKVQDKINIYIWCNKAQIPFYLDYYHNQLGCSFDILKWVKTNPIPNYHNKYTTDTEYCLYFRKGGLCQPENIEDGSTLFHQPKNIKDKNIWKHPTIKPIEILDRLIKNSSKEGDLVFDPFMGSGSTGVSALKNNRKFIGCELDKEFFEISQKRLTEDPQLLAA